ncbi:hypothetical protein [Aerobium aerolatum]|uniref:Autotransporter outer membrane beta-barrel domain-containing protein n=1 Tax=Aquamicrobium aerolatum DSM 21857 TaxID=1121003 RepID=A0A1I3R6N9_9HYPH|nr:hypothetical protein [Aquamicrobium aerolatum]SFJ41785.1 hypothetical protein SAMN03080618_02900 [Aquamicrobium aerolatum DSM 21857]
MVSNSDHVTTASKRQYTKHITNISCHPPARISPHKELKAILMRATCGATFTLGTIVGLSGNLAFAADCGAPAGGAATCIAPGGNPYNGGIIYNNPGSFTLNVGSGIVVDRAAADFNDGIQVHDESGVPLTVNLDTGVTIKTDGLHADGVEVMGTGRITISSGADVTANSDNTDFNGTSGLFGWIEQIAGTGDISINQLAGSTIRATGDDVFGIYGLNKGSGSVTLESSGAIFTAGVYAYGINAFNYSSIGANTTVILGALGSVVTDGESAAGLYSLNSGSGNAIARADGTITTLQDWSDGVLADVHWVLND